MSTMKNIGSMTGGTIQSRQPARSLDTALSSLLKGPVLIASVKQSDLFDGSSAQLLFGVAVLSVWRSVRRALEIANFTSMHSDCLNEVATILDGAMAGAKLSHLVPEK